MATTKTEWSARDFRAARVRAGLSQSGLAHLLGVTQKRLSRHETGQIALSSHLLLRAIALITEAQRSVDNAKFGDPGGL